MRDLVGGRLLVFVVRSLNVYGAFFVHVNTPGFRCTYPGLFAAHVQQNCVLAFVIACWLVGAGEWQNPEFMGRRVYGSMDRNQRLTFGVSQAKGFWACTGFSGHGVYHLGVNCKLFTIYRVNCLQYTYLQYICLQYTEFTIYSFAGKGVLGVQRLLGARLQTRPCRRLYACPAGTLSTSVSVNEDCSQGGTQMIEL